MKWDEMAAVGRIARAHGIRGQVIVNPDTDFADERFRPGARVFVEQGGVIRPLRIATARFHRDRPVVGFSGIDTMNDAQGLAGLELRVPLEELKALPEGTFYRHDLVGCVVETVGGASVGIVASVEGTATGSRLVVDGVKGEVLIPLVTPICTRIDTEAKRIVVDPPEGLLDLN